MFITNIICTFEQATLSARCKCNDDAKTENDKQTHGLWSIVHS